MIWVWKISPKNVKFFKFFQVKKISGQRWVGQVKSILGPGQGQSLFQAMLPVASWLMARLSHLFGLSGLSTL